MNKKRSFAFLFLSSILLVIASLAITTFYFQKNVTREESKSTALIIFKQVKRDLLIGDYRRVFELLNNQTFGNFKIIDIDILHSSKRILSPFKKYDCQGILRYCLEYQTDQKLFLQLERPQNWNLYKSIEFKLFFLLIILISVIYNFILIKLFSFQLDNFMATFNKIIKRKKLSTPDIEDFGEYKHDLLMLEKELEDYSVFIKESQTQETKNKIAMQISHDIRSPLAALSSISENLKKSNFQEYGLLQKTISRIYEISNKLLSNQLSPLPEHQEINSLIEEIIVEKKQEYNNLDLKIEFQSNSKKYGLIEAVEFKRIISNLLNNSIESNIINPHIKLLIDDFENFIKIQIADNGKGIPHEILNDFGRKEVTTKLKGNGIGVTHAYSTISSWGGRLDIKKTNLDGTILEISLLKKPVLTEDKLSLQFFLIDDDELTRTVWEQKALKKSISFKAFSNIQSFKENIDLVGKEAMIYIDSELGDIKGEDFAEELHNQGYVNISITSGHHEENFKNFSFLKAIISKKPPF